VIAVIIYYVVCLNYFAVMEKIKLLIEI